MVAALAAALALGCWADDLAERRHMESWVRTRSPSERVWMAALGAEGFPRVGHEALGRRLARGLPSLAEPPGSVWASVDGRWIAIYLAREETGVEAVFHADRSILAELVSALTSSRTGRVRRSIPKALDSRLPGAWRPIGRGWPAFEEALRLAQAAQKSRPLAVLRTSHSPGDPREIRF